MQVNCIHCGASLKAKPEWVGKRAKCPTCGKEFAIPEQNVTPKHAAPPATERQKEYARSLGIEFSDNISRREISILIDQTVAKKDEERYQRLEEISRREGEAFEEIRQQILAEIDEDEEDCRLSMAEPKQMVEALSARETIAILITMPSDEVTDFEDLEGVNIQINYSDDIDQKDMERSIMMLGVNFMKRRGMLE